MGAFRPTTEAHDVSLLELMLTLGRAERHPSTQDDEPLLVRMMVVIGPELLTGIDLEHAATDELGADPLAEPARPRRGWRSPSAQG
jgi:hypothetical protein